MVQQLVYEVSMQFKDNCASEEFEIIETNVVFEITSVATKKTLLPVILVVKLT